MKRLLAIAWIVMAVAAWGQTPPSLEDFEGYGYGQSTLPNGWTRESNYDMGNQPHIDDQQHASGQYSLYMGCGVDNSMGHYSRIYSHRIDIGNLSSQYVRLKLRASAANAQLVVGVAKKSNDRYNSGFVAIDTLRAATANRWQEYLVDLSTYSDTGHYLVLQMVRGMQPGICHIFVDDLIVEPCGIWEPAITHQSPRQLTLAFTSYGEGLVSGECSPVGGGETVVIPEGTLSPYTIEGLQPETEYQITLHCSCDGVHNASSPHTITGTTLKLFALTANYCENFESNGASMPSAWPSSMNQGLGQASVSSQRSYDGDYALRMTSRNGQGATVPLPEIVGTEGHDLEWKMKVWTSSTTSGYLMVGSMEHYNEAASFRATDTIRPTTANEWTEIFFTTPLLEQNPALKYVVEESSSQTLVIDQLMVGTCLPHHIRLEQPSDRDVRIHWKGPTSITLEYGQPGFAQGLGTIVEVDLGNDTEDEEEHSYLLSGLSHDMPYEVIVNGNCSYHSRYCSDIRHNFLTLPEQILPTYCNDFESLLVGSIPENWVVSQSLNSRPRIDETSEGKCLTFTATGNTFTMIALPPMYEAPLNEIVVAMDIRCSTTAGQFTLGAMSDPHNPATFVAIGEAISCASANQWQRVGVELTGYSGEGHCLAIKYSGNGIGYVDNFQASYCDVENTKLYDITDTSITLMWNTLGKSGHISIEYGPSGFSEGQGTRIELDTARGTHHYTLTQLSPESSYDVIVHSECEPYGGTCSTQRHTATTLDEMPEDHYCLELDQPINRAMPAGWQQHGSFYLLPKIASDELSQLRLTLVGVGSNNRKKLAFGILATPYDTTTYQQIAQFDITLGEKEYSAFLGNRASLGTLVLRFDSSAFSLTQVEISRCQIVNAQYKNVGAQRVTLSWDEAQQPATIAYKKHNETAWQQVEANSAPYTLETLEADTEYDVKLWSLCEGTEDCIPSRLTFRTHLDTTPKQYCNTLDEAILPAGWTTNNTSRCYAVEEEGHNGTSAIHIEQNGTILALNPFTDETIDGEILTIWAYGENAQAKLQIGLSSDPLVAGAFTPIQTIEPIMGRWTKHHIVLHNPNGGLYPTLKCTGGSLKIDDIEIGRCAIDNIRLTDIDSNSLKIYWDTVGTDFNGGVWVAYGEPGFAIENPILYNSNPIEIENLIPDNEYEFCVWGACRPLPCSPERERVHVLGTSFEAGVCYTRTDTASWLAGCREIETTMGRFLMLPKFIEEDLYISFAATGNGANTIRLGNIDNPYLPNTATITDVIHPTDTWSHYEIHVTTDGYIIMQIEEGAEIDSISVRACSLGDITIRNITQTTAQLEWSGNAQQATIEYYKTEDPENATRTTVNHTGEILTGLEPAQYYTIKLWPQCDGEETSCTYSNVTIQTLHPTMGIPYCEAMDDTLMRLPSWRALPNENLLRLTETPYHNSRPSAQISAIHGHTIAIMPDLLEDGDTCTTLSDLMVNLWLRFSTTRCQFEIGAMSDVYDSTTFETIKIVIPGAENSWSHYLVSLNDYAGSGKYLAFRFGKTQANNEEILAWIDDLCIERCIATAFRVYNTTDNSVTIAWNSETVDSVRCEYGPSNITPGEGDTIILTSNPFILEGLESGQSYRYYFTPLCGCNIEGIVVNDDQTGHGGGYTNNTTDETPASTTSSTHSGPNLPPTCETFENYPGRNYPTWWNYKAGTALGYPRITTEYAFKGSHSLEFYTTHGSSNIGMMPRYSNHEINNVLVSLYAMTTEESAITDSEVFQIGVMTNLYADSTFYPIGDIKLSDINSWQRFTFDFTTYEGPNGNIAFRFSPNEDAYSLYIDNVEVQYCGIDSVTFANETNHSLDISWQPLRNVSRVTIEYGHRGHTYGTGSTIQSTTDNAHIEGLDSGYAYDFYLSTSCNGASYRGCTPPLYSYIPSISLPYCTTFENEEFFWWITKKVSGRIPTIVSEGDTNMLELVVNEHQNTGYTLMELPTLAQGESLDGKFLKIEYRSTSASDARIEIGYLEDSSNARSFVVLDTIYATSADVWHSHIKRLHVANESANRLALRAISDRGEQQFHIRSLSLLNNPDPLDVHTIETGYSQKHIYWSESSEDAYCEIEYGPAGFNPGEGTTLSSDSCHIILHDLTANSDYDFYFKSGTNYGCKHYSFTTSTPIAIPYCDVTDYTYNGQTHEGWAIIPEPDVEYISQVTLLFNALGEHDNINLEVGTIYNPDDPTTFEPLYHQTIDGQNNNTHIVSYNGYDGPNRYLTIRTLGGRATISNLEVTPCRLPEISIVDAHTVKLAIDGTADGDYYCRLDNGTSIHITENPYYLHELEEASHHTITTQCNRNSDQCVVTREITLPHEGTIPFCENFDNGESLPASWSKLSSIEGYPTSSNVGQLLFRGNSQTSLEYAILPYFDWTDITNIYINCDAKANAGCSLVIGFLENPSVPSTFTPYDTLSPGSEWSHTELKIANPNGFLAFKFQSRTPSIGSLMLDNLNIETCPTVHYSLVGYNAVRIAVADEEDVDYYLDYGIGSARETIHIDQSPYTIENLTTLADYTFEAHCQEQVASCRTATQITTSTIVPLPYCEYFDATPIGWFNSSVSDSHLNIHHGNHTALPELDLTDIDHVIITGQTSCIGTTNGMLVIGALPDPRSANDFYPLDTILCAGENISEPFNIKLENYALHGQFLALMAITATGQGLITLSNLNIDICDLPKVALIDYNRLLLTTDSESSDYYIEYGERGFLQGQGTSLHGQGQSFRINGLQSLTHYDIYLKCNDAPTCRKPVQISTSELIEAPACFSFDTNNTIPQGWIHNSNYDGYPSMSDGAIIMRGYNNLYNEYVSLPAIEVANVNNITLAFDLKTTFLNGPALAVGVMTDPNDASTFIVIDTILANLDWTHHEVVLSRYDGNGIFVSFKLLLNTENRWRDVLIDNISIDECPLPNVLLKNHNSILFDIPFTDNADYYVDLQIEGDTTITAMHVTQDPFTLNNLIEDTTYLIWTKCNSIDLTCKQPKRISTTRSYPLPYCDDYSSLPGGFRTINDLWLLPEFQADVNDIRIVTNVRFDTPNQNIEIGVLSDLYDESTFIAIDTITVATANRWTRIQASLERYYGQGIFIALRPSHTMEVRDLRANYCQTPDDVTIHTINGHQIELEWDEQDGLGFWFELCREGQPQGSGALIHATQSPLSVTLDYNTTYDLYLVCNEGASACRKLTTYTTFPEPIAIPYCESFDTLPDAVLQLSALYPQATYHVLPEMDEADIDNLILAIRARIQNVSQGVFSVGIMSDPYDESTFTEVSQINQAQGLSNEFQRFYIPLRNYVGAGRFIAFRLAATSSLAPALLQIDSLFVSNCGAIDFRTTMVESDYITFQWQQSGSPFITIEYGPMGFSRGEGIIVHPETSPYTQEGLEPLTNYTFFLSSSCGDTTTFCNISDSATFGIFTPIGGNTCIDATKITSEGVTCTYGSYENPYAHQGIIDYGFNSPQSRHTVHFDTTERDPRTSGLLRTVPEGSNASVRLGNWISGGNAGPQAESITYSIDVDLANFDILLLKYAALLQDPNHDVSQQPRFRIQILNDQMEVLDGECGSADFIANINLGWNRDEVHDVLWKDWTTVGLDLQPYDGQTIFVRLTTYDCGEGSHYGYAYFSMDCLRKNIHSEHCGFIDENLFTAPSGFNYRWYTDQDPDHTISTEQSISRPSNNDITYLCDCSFIENSNCSFTMAAYAGVRFPLARFSYSYDIRKCRFYVRFDNQSVISDDGFHPVASNEGCESALWLLGNGDSSTIYNPQIIYDAPGDYVVTLYSFISNGECVDSITDTIHLTYPAHDSLIHGDSDRCINAAPVTLTAPQAYTYHWLGTNETSNRLRVAPDTTTTYRCAITDLNGCADTLLHTLSIHPTFDFRDSLAICEQHFPHTWLDTLLAPGSAAGHYLLHRSSQHSCDSNHHLYLTVHQASSGHYSDTIVENDLPWTYLDSSFSSPTRTTLIIPNHHGCDSLIDYTLFVYPNIYTYLDSTICAQYLPITWDERPFTSAMSDTVILPGNHGVDSLVIRRLATIPSDTTHLIDSVCIGSTYTFFDQQLALTGTYHHTLSNWFQCDSVVMLHLLQLQYPTIDFDITYDCNSEEYTIQGITDVPYYSWSSTPPDLSILGQEHLTSIIVSPADTTTYSLLVDYSPFGRCPTTADTTREPVIHVDALLEVSPEVLTFSRLTIQAKDHSIGSLARQWSIDGQPIWNTDPVITYTAQPESDSVVVTLDAFNNLCHDTSTFVVQILKSSIYAPNVFTPNAATNRTFFLAGDGILQLEIHIYNREGSIVFHSTDPHFQWDGTSDGRTCPQANYVYRVRYRREVTPETWNELTGSVLLLR